MRHLLIAALLLTCAAPSFAQVSYTWSRTETVVAAPEQFTPALDLPAFSGAQAHGWAILTAAWFAHVVAPALQQLPPVPGLFAAESAELDAVPHGGRASVATSRLGAVAKLNPRELEAAAARLDAASATARTDRWIEGPLEPHVVPDITNRFRQLCPLSIELEGVGARHAVLVYKVEQGFVAVANQPDSAELPATRYLLVDPAVRDARAVSQCYLMYIPAMKAYSFSPYLAQRLQAGAVFTGRLQVLEAGEAGPAHTAD